MKAEYLELCAGGEERWKCQCFCEEGNVKEVLRKGDRIKRTPRVNIEERDIKLLQRPAQNGEVVCEVVQFVRNERIHGEFANVGRGDREPAEERER
jgi:hypothetical protein